MKNTIHHLMTALIVLSSFASAQPAVIGHRGASAAAPENTIASIKEAWKEGADGTEVDIYLTKDGRIVTIHDRSTKRTAGTDLPVEEQTLEDLRKLDAGSWKDAKWKGERIPTLEESLAAIPDGKIVYIEIKGGPEMLPELKRILDASKKPKAEIFLIDFKIGNLIKAEPLFPDIRKLWIVGAKRDKETKEKVYPEIGGLIEKAKAEGLDGLDLEQGFPLDDAAAAKITQQGLLLAVWTVNAPEMVSKWVRLGADAITTDRPRFVRECLPAKN